MGWFWKRRSQQRRALSVYHQYLLDHHFDDHNKQYRHHEHQHSIYQDRREMERIRGDGGVARPRAIIPHAGSQVSPYDGGGSGRQLPPRTRSMPHPNGLKPKSSVHSLAHGGVAVLDPKKDKRKQTRKLKTATGAVGGAVVGGLILGPVGVVLGAGGGAAISNKVAKSRDKRKQSEFEQRNFQKGADHSVARQGDGAFA